MTSLRGNEQRTPNSLCEAEAVSFGATFWTLKRWRKPIARHSTAQNSPIWRPIADNVPASNLFVK